MYKAAVRALVRHSIAKLNEGDSAALMRFAAPDVELVFPGDNSWAAMFREVEKRRDAHATHRGIDECRAFADRFVANRIQFAIEDILVNGPPWNTRIALRVHDYIGGEPGEPDIYNNRAVAFIEMRWFRVTRWEDYEDTERVAAWERAIAV